MINLSRLFTGKTSSSLFKLMNTNFSQLAQKNVFYFATKTINLPFLADSINEGTIAGFVKK